MTLGENVWADETKPVIEKCWAELKAPVLQRVESSKDASEIDICKLQLRLHDRLGLREKSLEARLDGPPTTREQRAQPHQRPLR